MATAKPTKSARRVSGAERRVTAKEVAELAGVSISAVSRTMTEGASVSAETREKVAAAARTLGYQPNALARSLMTRRTDLIALISNHFDSPLFMEVFDLFTRRLQLRGRRPLLANLSGGARKEGALQMLLKYSVDGAIVASSTLPQGFTEACAESGMPVVQAFGRPSNPKSGNVVGADNYQGGRLAGDMLRERGYTSIAFLGGPQTSTSTEDRLRGFRDGLAIAAVEPCAIVYGHSYCHEAGFTLMKQLLRNGGIDAVFCGDDVLAMGAMDACREAGVDVPRDMGVIGFDNMAMAAWPAYNLTTIHQPAADIIITAVELLLSIVDQSDATAHVRLFNCKAIERGTLRRVLASGPRAG
jgi:DNA-binding LacI/PurR family transcriptional regulator